MRKSEAAFLVCAPLVFFLVASCRPAVDRTLEETIAHRYPVEPTATLSVTNRDGSIRVYGAAGDTREVQSWLEQREQAATITGLYGK